MPLFHSCVCPVFSYHRDSGPRQAVKDTDAKVKPKPRTPTSSDPNQVRRKRGRPRAPPIDVRDLSPDYPRVAHSTQQQRAQQQDGQHLKMEPVQDDGRGGRSGVTPDAGRVSGGLRGTVDSDSQDTFSGGSSSGSGHAGASLPDRQQRSRVMRTLEHLEPRDNRDMNVPLSYIQQPHMQVAATPRLAGSLHPQEQQQEQQQQQQQQQLHKEQQHYHHQQQQQESQQPQQMRQVLRRQLHQVQELEQGQAMQQQTRLAGALQRHLSGAASDGPAESLNRRQRHVMLLRNSSDTAADPAVVAMGLGAGSAGSAAAVKNADMAMSGAWQRGSSLVHGGGDGGAGGGSGMGRLGQPQGSTVDPLDLELLSIASESLMSDQELSGVLHNGGLPGGTGLVLGLPHSEQLQPQHRQPQYRHYQPLQLNLNLNQNQPQHVLRLDTDPVGIPRGSFYSGLVGGGSTGSPMPPHTVTAAVQSLMGRTGCGELVNPGRPGGRNPLLVMPGGAGVGPAMAPNGILGPHGVRAGSHSGSGSDAGGMTGRVASSSPGNGLGDMIGVVAAEGGSRSLMEPLLSDFGISNSTGGLGGSAMAALSLRLPSQQQLQQQQQQQQHGVLPLGRTQQGLGAGSSSSASTRGLLGCLGASTRTLDLTASDSLLHPQHPGLPPQYRLHQPHQHRPQHHLLQQAQRGSSNVAPNLKEVAQNLLAQGGSRAAYTAPSSVLERLNLKIYQRRPDELSPDLAEHLADLLANSDASVLQGSIRPGCTNLVLDILSTSREGLAAGLLGSAGEPGGLQAAAQRIMRAVLGEGAVSQDCQLHVQFRDTLLVINGGQVQLRPKALTAAPASGHVQPVAQCNVCTAVDTRINQEILGMEPMAVVAGCEFTLELLGCGLQLSGTTFHVRFRGQHLDVMPELSESQNGRSGSSTVPAADSIASLAVTTQSLCDDAHGRHARPHVISPDLAAAGSPRPFLEPLDAHRVISAQARAPLSLCSIASTASAASSSDSSAVATTGCAPLVESCNPDGSGARSGASTTLSAEERAILSAISAPVETELYCKHGEVHKRSTLLARMQATATASAAAQHCARAGSGHFEVSPDDRPPRILAGLLPAAVLSYMSQFDTSAAHSECCEVPLCEAEDTEYEWGSSEGLDNKPPIGLRNAGGSGGNCYTTAISALSRTTVAARGTGDGSSCNSDGRHVTESITSGRVGRMSADTLRATQEDGRDCTEGSGQSTAPPAVTGTTTAVGSMVTAPLPEHLSWRTGSRSEVLAPLGHALSADEPRGANLVSEPWRQGPPYAPAWVPADGVTDYSASGGGSGAGSGLPTEAYISSAGASEGMERTSEYCSQVSSASGGSLGPEVVVLFVDRAPWAGLALVEAESPPLPLYHSPATAAAVFQSEFRSGRSSGGDESGGNGIAPIVTAGVLTDWWPLVVVPAGAAPAAAEINTLSEERGQTWLRDLIVDYGLVLEALDRPDEAWTVDAFHVEAAASKALGGTCQPHEHMLSCHGAVHHPTAAAVDIGCGQVDESGSAIRLCASVQAASPTTANDDAVAISSCASSGIWGSGVESILRCAASCVSSSTTGSSGRGEMQAAIPAAEPVATAAGLPSPSVQSRLLAGLPIPLIEAAAAPVIKVIQAQGSLQAAVAAVASAEASPQAARAMQRPAPPQGNGAGGQRGASLNPVRHPGVGSTGAMPPPCRSGDGSSAVINGVAVQHDGQVAAAQTAGQQLSDPGSQRRMLEGTALEEAAMAYHSVFSGRSGGGHDGGGNGGDGGGDGGSISTAATASYPLVAAGGDASHVTRSIARPLQGCVAAVHRSSDPSDSSLSPSLLPLVELTASEAARFLGFTASAEVTCEQSVLRDSGELICEGFGGGSPEAPLAPLAATAPPTMDESRQYAAVGRAKAVATAMILQQQQRQQQQRQEAHTLSHESETGSGCAPAEAAAAAAAPAPATDTATVTAAPAAAEIAGAAAGSRREQVVQQWRELQQRELPSRARSLLVFFCNRGFHHCARLVLAFLLRHVGLKPVLADAITCPHDEGVATLAAISRPNSSLDLTAQLDRLPRVFELLAHQIRAETGLGLLHHAVRSGSLETVELVLLLSCRMNAPLDILEQSPDGVTPAHLAALLPGRSAAIMEAMIEHATRAATKRSYDNTAAAAAVTTFQAAQMIGSGLSPMMVPPISSTRDISTVAMLGTELERMVLHSGAMRKSGEHAQASDVDGSGVGPADVPECRRGPCGPNAFREPKSSCQIANEVELASARSSVQSWFERLTEGPQPCATSVVAAGVPASTQPLISCVGGYGYRLGGAVVIAAAAAVLAILPSSGPNKMLLSAALVLWCLAVLWLAAARVTAIGSTTGDPVGHRAADSSSRVGR
ncbi:hypothetical protein Vafri_3422 [Volvox africanus]|uniref:Uncharacterized protein n=1 Tax=Volvox africanus TaxID=51714 RepID=A0A8J4ATE8_9CHLO|nr:hypothetical protein Vafri_3422 [Volvox africanus]